MNFDSESWFEELDNEPELSDKKYRFKERVNRLMKSHNFTKSEAEECVTRVIKEKEQVNEVPTTDLHLTNKQQ